MSAQPRHPYYSSASNDPVAPGHIAESVSRPTRAALPLSTRAALAALLARHRVLTVPGWNNSGPAHWQTLWEQEFPALTRVQQREWATPDPDEWVATLHDAVQASRRPTILVAHSLGCVTVARWAAAHKETGRTWPVVGALLVAPADVERPGANIALRAFAPIATERLPFGTHVVGSNNDRCCSESRAREFARRWGAGFSLVENGGHINAESGVGAWPGGLAKLAWLNGG